MTNSGLSIDAAHAGNPHRHSVITTFVHERNFIHADLGVSRLFLLSTLFLSLGRSTLLADTNKTSLGASLAERPVGILGTLVVGDGTLLELGDVADGQDRAGRLGSVLALLGSLDFLLGSVTLSRLAVAAREEDEALPVLLEALHVGLEALLREVLTAGVDGDTDRWRELAGNASGLRLISMH